jgi:hypothetical protein
MCTYVKFEVQHEEDPEGTARKVGFVDRRTWRLPIFAHVIGRRRPPASLIVSSVVDLLMMEALC